MNFELLILTLFLACTNIAPPVCAALFSLNIQSEIFVKSLSTNIAAPPRVLLIV